MNRYRSTAKSVLTLSVLAAAVAACTTVGPRYHVPAHAGGKRGPAHRLPRRSPDTRDQGERSGDRRTGGAEAGPCGARRFRDHVTYVPTVPYCDGTGRVC